MSVQENIFEKRHRVLQATRSKIFSNGPIKGCTVWLTGLSGAGKTTISFHLEEFLVSHGIATYSLDGDNVRKGLNKNLAFSESDREENVRRVAEVGRLFADAGFVCLCSLVSPYSKDRKMARDIHEAQRIPFFEVFVNTPLEICEKRDVKGLYEKARKGIIKQFTGIDQPYESPVKPDLVVETVQCSIESAIQQVTKLLLENNIIKLKLPNGCGIASENVIVKELFVNSVRKDAISKHLQHLPKIELSRIDMEWLQVLSEGWASPLDGFMNEKQYLQALHFNSLITDDGVTFSQSVPIVLAIDEQKKQEIEQSSQNAVSLWFRDRCYALLNSYEIYEHRKEERCCRQFGTSNQKHPYVKLIYESGNWLIGGRLEVLERIMWNDGLDQFRLTPNELRQKFNDLETDAVYAFQLRNPIHNGHALLMSDTKKKLLSEGYQKPILLLHPLGGWTKDDDVPLRVRMKQHQAILDSNVIDKESTVLAIFPSPMMYAGPTEVQWHAKARMNAGVNFYIVGRDPAGIPHPDRSTSDGNLYEASHGSKVLNMAPNLNNLHIIPFKVASYDKNISKMTYFDPSRPEDFLFISGTKMRENASSSSLDKVESQLQLGGSGGGLALGRITGSASIETLVRVGIEKEHGLAPDSKMLVLHDFTPCVDDELEVKRRQVVNVLYRENDWVYVISMETKQEGFIPYSYCVPYNDQMADFLTRKKVPRENETADNVNLKCNKSSDNNLDSNFPFIDCDTEITPFYKDPMGSFVVLYTFIARDENDLSVERGELVTVLNKEDPDWYWVIRSDDQEGFIPSAFVLPVDEICEKGDTDQDLEKACAKSSQTFNVNETNYQGTEFIMLYDYKAQAPDDLSVKRGEWIYADVTNQNVEGWLWSFSPKSRKYGFIPKAYARIPAMTSL